MDALGPDILIVDHAPSLRELLHLFLTDEGFDVTDVSLEAHSVNQIVRQPAGLYIVGLKPEEAKDLELLEQLRLKDPRPRVIVLATSARLLERVRGQSERYAGDRFLRLPLDLNDLLQAVRGLLVSA